jgi:uncharacterized cupin superfamily protein
VYGPVVAEARLRKATHGLTPEGDGWFVANAREARWRAWPPFGVWCAFEGKRRFPQVGINVSVLEPGEAIGLYHAEPRAQEDFLVVAGECLLLAEGEERPLREWDLVHCPPGTAHMIVGAGTGRSVVVGVGARGRRHGGIVYPVSAAAERCGVSVPVETKDAGEAYRPFGFPRRVHYEDGWLP